MTTFAPKATDRRYCVHCHAHRRVHQADGQCTQAYRPVQLAEASQALAKARATGDQAAEFVARGEVQRLGGDPDLVYQLVRPRPPRS